MLMMMWFNCSFNGEGGGAPAISNAPTEGGLGLTVPAISVVTPDIVTPAPNTLELVIGRRFDNVVSFQVVSINWGCVTSKLVSPGIVQDPDATPKHPLLEIIVPAWVQGPPLIPVPSKYL